MDGKGRNRGRRPKSRPIVHGHLERVSSRVLEDYREQITDLVGNQHGVYVLYRRDKLYYIGLATNLKRRVNQHLKDRHKGKWDLFSLYIIRKEDHIRELECMLLRIARPKGNNVQGKLRRSHDLLPVLKREVRGRIREEFDGLFNRGGKGGNERDRGGRHRVVSERGVCPLRGLLGRNQVLRANYKGQSYKAIVRPSGAIRFNGRLYASPSGAAKAIANKQIDGWCFWKCRDGEGNWIYISSLRK